VADERLRIVMLGMMGRLPWAGQAYIYLHWLRGFEKLGHEIWYVEDESSWPYDPIREVRTEDCSYALQHIETVLGRVGLGDRWAFRLAEHDGAVWGLTESELDDLYASCDVLVNLQGATDLREEHMAAPLRVYVQTDPVGAELRMAEGDEWVRSVFERHHVVFTYGENYGSPDSAVPLNGVKYLKTRQPVDLELWPFVYDPDARFFTTIGNYRQAGRDVEYQGEVYRWSKHHEWERFVDLPSRTEQEFELALVGTDDDDVARLEQHGWRVVPSGTMSLDVFGAYPDYIRTSRGEFTVAKDQNVRLRSGWFSDRDATYLASGKPVVAQDTGFGNVIPTGEGLFAFTTPEEATAAIEEINGDYERHARGARAIAEEYFDSVKITGKLLADLGLGR
jgi:hypothetical protein